MGAKLTASCEEAKPAEGRGVALLDLERRFPQPSSVAEALCRQPGWSLCQWHTRVRAALHVTKMGHGVFTGVDFEVQKYSVEYKLFLKELGASLLHHYLRYL